MNVHKFNFQEIFQDKTGKTSMPLFCAFLLILTGCVMGIRGAFVVHGDSMLQGLAFATVGAGLLGIRRFTNDKPIGPEAETDVKEKTKE